MPRVAGVYSPPSGTYGVSGTAISSASYNNFVDDLVTDANDPRPITAGGTGATSAGAARTALGAQTAHAALTSISGLATVADRMIYTTASNTYNIATLTAFARSILDDADASAVLTTLGVSAFIKTLLDDASAAAALTTLGVSSFAQTILDDTSAAAVRATIGVDPAGTTPIPSGTKMLFQQTAAPTGWTKDTTHNNKALRVVTGTASSGGTTAFTSVFASRTPAGSISNTVATGTVGGTALTTAQLPSHSHTSGTLAGTAASAGAHTHTVDCRNNGGPTTATIKYASDVGSPDSTMGTSSSGAHTHTVTIDSGSTGSAGSGSTHAHSLTMDAHNHSFTGTAMDFAVQYVDVIIATKD